MLRWQSLAVHLDEQSIHVAGSPVSASPAEFGLLSLLLRRRNVPLSKEVILGELFGSAHGRDPRLIDAAVMRLRRTLRAAGLPELIHAVAGRGYAALDEDGPDVGYDSGRGPRADQVLLAA